MVDLPIDNCAQVVAQALKISQKRARQYIEDIVAERSEGGTPADTAAATERLISAAQATVEKERVNVYQNALKRLKRNTFINRFEDKKLGIEALLSGVNTPAAVADGIARDYGSRLSTEAIYIGKRDRLMISGLHTNLEKAGVLDVFLSKTLTREINRELYNLNSATPGPPQHEVARQIAEILNKSLEEGRAMLNRSGATVQFYENYMGKNTHSPRRMQKAGKDKWKETVYETVDLERTFGVKDSSTPQAKAAIDRILDEVYEELAKGDHLVFEPLDFDAMMYANGASLAKARSQSRVLHYKDADSFTTYNEQFGEYDQPGLFFHTMDRIARDSALMDVWGTNPRQEFERTIKEYRDSLPAGREHSRIGDWERAMRNRFDNLDGTANRPTNILASDLTAGYLALQRTALYGMSALAQLSDAAFTAGNFRYWGAPLATQYAKLFTRYTRGAPDSTKREVGRILGVAMDHVLGQYARRMDLSDSPIGTIGKIENFFFKWNGMTKLNRDSKITASVVFANYFGGMKGTDYAGLAPEVRRGLDLYAINEREWNMLREVDWSMPDGRDYFLPTVVREVPDEVMLQYARERNLVNAKSSEAAKRDAIDRLREELETKIHAMYSSEADFFVPTPGVRERSILLQGTQPGSPLGIALRLFGAVKAFLSSVVTKTLGREIYGGKGKLGAVAGIIQTSAEATVFGLVSLLAYDLATGKDPLSRLRNEEWHSLLKEAYLRGGAGTFMADALLGDWTRYGGAFSNALLGPTGRTIDRLAAVLSNMTAGEWEKAGFGTFQALKTNMPFQNFIWTKAAMDYLFIFHMQEMLNPGYLERMERTMKSNYGTEFMLPPGRL